MKAKTIVRKHRRRKKDGTTTIVKRHERFLNKKKNGNYAIFVKLAPHEEWEFFFWKNGWWRRGYLFREQNMRSENILRTSWFAFLSLFHEYFIPLNSEEAAKLLEDTVLKNLQVRAIPNAEFYLLISEPDLFPRRPKKIGFSKEEAEQIVRKVEYELKTRILGELIKHINASRKEGKT